MADAKRQSLKKVNGEEMAKGVYLAEFSDGTTFRADLRDLPAEVDESGKVTQTVGTMYDAMPPMIQRTLQYGLKQKLDDAMAGSDTVEDAVSEITSTWEAIKAGKWTIRVAGEGVEGGLFARAYAEFNGIPLADAKAKISAMVERNLEANRAAIADPKKREELTERMVFNAIRESALARYDGLKAKYEELKAKRKSRPKSAGITVDLSED